MTTSIANAAGSDGGSSEEHADIILMNGKVITVNKNFDIAQAVAIKGNAIIAVGSNREAEKYSGIDTEIIDLEGKTVIPGLIDTHTHIDRVSSEKHSVDLSQAGNIPEALKLIEQKTVTLDPGEWIIGRPWHPPSQLREKRYLTRKELDSVSPGNPVFLQTVGHFAMVNSRSLEMAGITNETPDPPGGEIEKNSSGEITGILKEAAINLVSEIIPSMPLEMKAELIIDKMHMANKYGITSTVIGAADQGSMHAFKYIKDNDEATVRAGIMYLPTDEAIPSTSISEWENIISSLGDQGLPDDNWLKMAGIKFILDGGMTLRTAYMREHYPGDEGYFGTLTIPEKRFIDLVKICNKYGYRVGTHAVGDAAIDIALEAYEQAGKQNPVINQRYILIHASLMKQDQMERAKKLGVRADVQNVFMWKKGLTVERFLGIDNARRAVPVNSMINIMGIGNVGAGSDYSVNTINPFINIYTMVTRKDINGKVYGADQAISRRQALEMYTISAARYTYDENKKGSIEPGKLADLVVLSDDILTMSEENLVNVKVLRTIVDGESVYINND